MGNLELNLLLKYGVPLAVKLLREGHSTAEVETAVKAVKIVSGIAEVNVQEVLLKADDAQTESIVDGLFGVLTGVGDALGGLLRAIGELFS